MAYSLRWPGLQDLDVYVIDAEKKTIYDKQHRLPSRLSSINTLEHKYVRLIDIVSLFPNSMKVRVLNLVETLSSISSLKPLYKDKETELRFLHLSSLLAFILVYPFCKSFEKTRDEILRFLMGYSETVCMDCGFIQRECQCHIFSTDSKESIKADDISEVVGKATDSNSVGTQTDTVESGSQNMNLISPGQILGHAQIGPLVPGSLPSVVQSTMMQAPQMLNIPSVVPFSSSFGSPQPSSAMAANMFGAPQVTAIGSIYGVPSPSIISVTPTVSQSEKIPTTNIKLGNNVLYVPPDVLAKSADPTAQESVKSNVNSKSQNLFKLDPGTGMFMSEEFSLNPKTGKVTKRRKSEGSSKEQRKKQIRHAGKRIESFIDEDEQLDRGIVAKKRRRKKKKETVKELLSKGTTGASDDNVDGENDKSNPDETKGGNPKELKEKESEKKNLVNDNEAENVSEDSQSDKVGKEGKEDKDKNGLDGGNEVDNNNENDIESGTHTNGIKGPNVASVNKGKKSKPKILDGKEGSSDAEECSSSEEGIATDSREDGNTRSLNKMDLDEETGNKGDGNDSDTQVFDGIRYRVIAPKDDDDDSEVPLKPDRLKVKMPFADKMKTSHSSAQKVVVRPLFGKSSTPGSILAKCNFSYASSPTTGAPILQQMKKPTLVKGVQPGPPGTGKDKLPFSVVNNTPSEVGKGYAKFEFAQTGEKMLRCIIYTCGQVFDTEKFAEIHQNLHQQGSPKELRCKLCNFKGHVLKWYDMLRHLKETHGSVLRPKILPPKPKKSDQKKDEEKKSETDKDEQKNVEKLGDSKGKETSENKTDDDKKEGSEKNTEGKGETADPTSATDGKDQSSPLKADGEASKSTDANEEGSQKSDNCADVDEESSKKEFSETAGSPTKETGDNVENGKSEETTMKTDGLAALADVCDKLEPIATNNGSEVNKGCGASTEETKEAKSASADENPTTEKQLSNEENSEKADETKKSEEKEKEAENEQDKETVNEKPNEEENMCNLCGIKFDDEKALNSHSMFHYYNKYKCIHCGGIMYTWEHLQRHLKECADVEKGRVYFNCQYCHLSFRDRKSHYIHSISHGDPGLVCSYCDDDKSWDNWTALKKHYKVFHMAMRLLSAFKCDECNREFNTAKQYNNHMQDHKRRKERAAKMNKADPKEIDDMKDLEIEVTEDGQVKCPDCDQTFKNNNYMQMHHKFKHGEDITCPKCTYVAKSRLMLKIHMGKAHVEKSHKCGECGKTFAHYHQYKVHLSTHAQKTTFSCKFCQSGYPTQGELRQHMLKEHKLPAHKKLIQCEECEFKCFSRTTLRAHTRKNHPESSVIEDGEDHCYFNKKDPSPPPKPSKKTKGKLKNQETVEKMLETKSKYFIIRHNTCCRTRNYEQNMEIKNRKVAAEKRLLEGPKKRGRKPKSVFGATVQKEDPEVAEKKDPTWSPVKDKPTEDASTSATQQTSSEDAQKAHEQRAPNKRRSAPPKRYSPEREIMQVKKRAKSPPLRRPRSPKDSRRFSKSPVYKKRKTSSGYDPNSPYGYYHGDQVAPSSSTPYQSAQSVKERRKSAKQYEKRLKHEKPTLYAELMHVKRLKSVPMVVDQSYPLPIALLDHCYCRQNRPVSPEEQQHGDSSYNQSDMSIVSTPDVADYEECLTDDVEIPSPLHSYHRPKQPTYVTPRGQARGRQRGRPPGRVNVTPSERRKPVVVRGVLTGGSVSTLQLSNSNSGQFTRLGNLLSGDKGPPVSVRIAGSNTNMTPPPPTSTVTQVRTVMASPSDDSMEFESESLLPPGVEMQDDILRVAADMFINESDISGEISDSAGQDYQLSPNRSQTVISSSSASRYPKPIVISRPSTGSVNSGSVGRSQSRVIKITKHGLFDSSHPKVVTETVPQIRTESPRVVTETVAEFQPEGNEIVTETVYLESGDVVTVDNQETVTETYVQAQPDSGIDSTAFTESTTSVPDTSATDLQNDDSESNMTNEMAQELVQAILDHSRASETELDDIQLNEADYNMLLGSRNASTASATVTSSSAILSSSGSPQQPTRSLDHQYN